MRLLLYNTLIVCVVLDALASLFTATYVYRIRQRFAWYIAFAFTGVAIEAVVAVATMSFSPRPQSAIAWILVVRILARLFKAVALILLPLYMLGYLNGGKHDPK